MGLTFAWVKIKISALKNCEEFILVKCALREALKVVDYIRHLRNEGLWGKENSKISFFFNIGKAQIKNFSSRKQKFIGWRSSNKEIACE